MARTPRSVRGALTALALIFLLIGAGCRSSGIDLFGRPPMQREPIRPTQVEAARVVEQANANARKIQTLKSEATISRTHGLVGTVDGDLAYQSPHDFRLRLEHSASGSKFGDIGSNRDQFWFWINDDREYYAASYDEQGRSPLGGPIQPDWIRELLGLYDNYDPAQAKLERPNPRDPRRDVVVVRETRVDGLGQRYLKLTWIEPSGRVKRHVLYHEENRDKPIAEATVRDYLEVAANSEDGHVDRIVVPVHVDMTWVDQLEDERTSLTIKLKRRYLELNEPLFPGENASALAQRTEILFSEPRSTFEGMNLQRRDLGREMLAAAPSESETIRRSRATPSVEIELAPDDPQARGANNSSRIAAAGRSSLDPQTDRASTNRSSGQLGGLATRPIDQLVLPGVPDAPNFRTTRSPNPSNSARNSRFRSVYGREQ